MKNSELRSPWLRAFGLVVTLLGVAPALVFFRVPTADGLLTLAPLALCLLCLPISHLPKAGRVCTLIPLCLLCGLCALYISREDVGAARYVYIAISTALPVFALPSLFRERIHAELSVGIIATLVPWVLMRSPHIALCRAEVQRLAVVFLPLLLIYVNLAQLEWEGSAQRSGQVRGMKPANVALSCVVIALAFLAAFAEDIWRLIKAFIAEVLRVFLKMLAYEPQQEKPPAPVEGSEMDMIPPFVEEEPNIVVRILEITLYVLAIAAILLALAYILKRLPRILRRLYNWIRNALKRYIKSISAEGGDYVDISEDLRAGESGLGGSKRRRAKRKYRWDGLDNRRRIRAAYRLAVADRARPNKTARENLLSVMDTRPEAALMLAESYDRARYSDHPITDAEAEAARNALKPNNS